MTAQYKVMSLFIVLFGIAPKISVLDYLSAKGEGETLILPKASK